MHNFPQLQKALRNSSEFPKAHKKREYSRRTIIILNPTLQAQPSDFELDGSFPLSIQILFYLHIFDFFLLLV